MLFLPFDRKINDRIPWVIWGLLAVNVAVFVVVNWFHSLRHLQDIFNNYGAIPHDLHGYAWVTHLFLHANEAHLVGNMAFLLLFGMNVERKLGPAVTLGVYLLSGFAALAAFAAVNSDLRHPLIGASGAISGVVGMYLVLFRRRVVDVLWWAFVVAGIVRLPAVFVATFWFALEVLQALLFNKYAEVAHWAHVAGFAAGYLVILAGRRILPSYPDIYASTEDAPKAADRFEEKAYIPEAPAGPKADGLRLIARDWRPLTSGLRRIVDGVLPGSGAFATPARIAAGLAPPQAEDLRARLERAGFLALIQPQEREIPSAPLVFIDELSAGSEGLILRDPRGVG
ncbi:MAG TPA: rhomboid family intramembrane serine protease, partial [Planctomycetota bacterium]|nr:rhomboid family intramembrane serine protease [Planctomycetota bacterium]